MLIVLASMERELAGLRSRVRQGMPRSADSLGASAPEMHVLGMGYDAGQALRSLLQRRYDTGTAPLSLLMLGVAGAVQPGLQTGDLVLSSRYYRPRLDETLPFWSQEQPPDSPRLLDSRLDREAQPEFLEPDPGLWRWALAAAGDMHQPVVYADSLTVSGLVTTTNAKRDIHRRYPAAVVNMEDYWAARAAREAGIPFIAARAVLDTAQQSLPSYLCRIAGSPRGAIAGASAVPWRLPVLLGLWRRFGIAQRALTDFAVNFLAQATGDFPAPAGATAAAATAGSRSAAA